MHADSSTPENVSGFQAKHQSRRSLQQLIYNVLFADSLYQHPACLRKHVHREKESVTGVSDHCWENGRRAFISLIGTSAKVSYGCVRGKDAYSMVSADVLA